MDELENNKIIAGKLLEAVGGDPEVFNYYDDNKTASIDLFIGADRPFDCVNTVATIGLSNYSIGIEMNDGTELRTEFIGACDSSNQEFANVVSTCAFNIINSNYSCSPGTVYPDVIREYYPEHNMKHVLFVSPFLWEDLADIEMPDKYVAWLMLVPISENELEFLKTHSADELEELFAEKDIDVFNLNRESVV